MPCKGEQLVVTYDEFENIVKSSKKRNNLSRADFIIQVYAHGRAHTNIHTHTH
eukprot:c29734_g1_i1 orf=3-158(-)